MNFWPGVASAAPEVVVLIIFAGVDVEGTLADTHEVKYMDLDVGLIVIIPEEIRIK